jgi:rsbT co-antagonist protein RsbR
LVELINEISTPLLPIGDAILVLPLIGSLDSLRAKRMISDVLRSVAERRTQALILDISGVPLVDTHVGAAILQLARSVRLLGCQCVLVGIRPEIAQTLVSIGTDLSELTTCATITQGLTAVGVRIVRG